MTQNEYLEAMLEYIPKYYEANRPMEELTLSGLAVLYRDKPCEAAVRQYDGTEKALDCYLCGITRWNCYITPEGRLLPCLPMTASSEQSHFPKVQEIGLKQGLRDSFYMQFVNGRIKDLFEVNEECNACQYRFRCGGGCRAIALTNGEHNLMGCDRLMCMFWKNGYTDRLYQILDEMNSKYGREWNKGKN